MAKFLNCTHCALFQFPSISSKNLFEWAISIMSSLRGCLNILCILYTSLTLTKQLLIEVKQPHEGGARVAQFLNCTFCALLQIPSISSNRFFEWAMSIMSSLLGYLNIVCTLYSSHNLTQQLLLEAKQSHEGGAQVAQFLNCTQCALFQFPSISSKRLFEWAMSIMSSLLGV